MSVSESLFRLDRLDAQIEKAQSDLEEARRRQSRHPELDDAENRLESLQQEESDALRQQRSLDASLAEIEGKIKRDQARMYSGQIVDSRELTSLERELQHYAEQRDALEDQVLTMMERLEKLQENRAAMGVHADELRNRWQDDQPVLADHERQTANDLSRLQSEREELASSLDPRSLDLYRRMRSSMGHAIAVVSKGTCQACHVGIPAKDIQHARSGALVMCTNCGRILHPDDGRT